MATRSSAFFALVLFALVMPCATFFVPVSLLATVSNSPTSTEEHEERVPNSETHRERNSRERNSQPQHRRERAYPLTLELLRANRRICFNDLNTPRSLVGHRINEVMLAPIRC
ncbi:hypothetical protein Pla52o_26990 [Novipirellula galeiformis]|uniref:Uncharacterized protein n=1 Tax=Novipirellula galeiformis TaxID=2528004 RepID=A0A5C6CI33_9BACT|nr:hypothetical protein Pla52o_26990 [Novipirellula galeiformis]